MADVIPPYVSHVENPDSAKHKGAEGMRREFGQRKWCRVLHMGIEGSAEKKVVPIVWKRLVSPETVMCMGIVEPEGTAVRFFLPLAQYLELQRAIVEV